MNIHVKSAHSVRLPTMRKYADPKLEKSDGVMIDGALYGLDRRDADGITLMSLMQPVVQRRLSRREFWELYYGGRLSIHRGTVGSVDPVVAKLLQRPLASFPKDDQDEAMRRLFYIEHLERLYAAGRVSLTRLGYVKAIRQAAWLWRRDRASDLGVAQKKLPLEQPSAGTLKEWRSRYVSSGKQLVALVPAHSEKGNTGSKLDGRVEVIVDELVRERFLTQERIPLAQVHDEICSRVMQLNDTLPQSQQLPDPHVNTVSAWIKRHYTDFEILVARHDRDFAVKKMKQVKKGPVGLWPMHTIQMDYVRLDVAVLTPEGHPLFGKVRASRPWLVMATCTLTDMVVGWYLTFEAPNWQSAMACLRHAVLPKDLSRYPGVLSDYPCMGGFAVLMMDNEKAFRSMSLKVAVASLKATVKWGPAGTPSRRGKIERTIRSFNADVTGFMPGKTFSNVTEKGDYDPVARAAYSFEELEARVARWVVDIHHNRPRGLFGLTPLQKWEKFGGTVSVLDSAADLDALLAITVQRTIQREGVRVFGLRYNHPALQKLINRSGGKGREYAIKMNPADLGDILVYDDMDEKWLYVPCTEPEYAEGLDIDSRRREMALARKLNGGNSPSRRHLLKAREDLNREAAAKGAQPKKYTDPKSIEYYTQHLDDPLFDMLMESRPKRRRRGADDSVIEAPSVTMPDPEANSPDPIDRDQVTDGSDVDFDNEESW